MVSLIIKLLEMKVKSIETTLIGPIFNVKKKDPKRRKQENRANNKERQNDLK